ncbi:MAG: DNA-formamidopyrimidine glycosylase, partial [bacterium]|nr:DNA-formamidopyrimidine glycosylase [bacterium]
TVHWPRTVGGNKKNFTAALKNKTLSHIHRRGKYICLYLEDGQCLTIHLRMTGKLLFKPGEKDKKYIRTAFRFTDGSSLYFADVRKFGRMKIWPPNQPLLPQLGPEPLEEKTVFPVLATLTSRRAIKTVLLDQKVLAGVGNIYADEALFKAGIHPLTPAAAVPEQQLRKLGRHLPEILTAAIKNKGTTISDYRSTDGSEGGNQLFLNVYGRTGEPCTKCKTPIIRIRVNNRSSHFCPICQPEKKPRKPRKTRKTQKM